MNASFGDWVRSGRTAKKWSQTDLAAESGVSQPQISNIEAGISINPQAATRKKLAKALGGKPPAVTQALKDEIEVGPGIGDLTDFDPHDDSGLPDCKGVYVFYDLTERPVYVGMAYPRSICERVRDHQDKFWFKRPLVQMGAYVEIKEKDLCAKVEKVLIRFLKSNALLNKQHVDRA